MPPGPSSGSDRGPLLSVARGFQGAGGVADMARLDRSRLQRLGLPRGASERRAHNWPAVCTEGQRPKAGRRSCRGYLRHVRSKFSHIGPEQNRLCGIADIGRESEGRVLFGRIGPRMRRPTTLPFDRMNFPLTLTDELRATFAETASSPLPRRLSALIRRLDVDHDERQEGEPGNGASATGISSHIDRRGRR